MKQKSIRSVIWLATIALIAVVIMQFFWINKSINTQKETIDIQKKNIDIEHQQFENRVYIALTTVRDKLISLNDEAAGFYLDPVKQITKNYFVVSFYDTLSHELLENFLISEFQQRHILEAFEYGIYDCFSDSIIYDKYVGLSETSRQSDKISATQQKWDHDGHYFGVYFPDREELAPSEASKISYSLIITSVIIILIVAIFTFAISIILRQKKLSEIRNDFINNMTHELKTPISTISISAEVLLRKDTFENSERIQQYAKIIRAENNRLEAQVEKVLQLAKLEKEQIQLNRSIINLHTIVKEVSETFEITIKEREGQLSLDLSASQQEIDADPIHITNVIASLLDNANKYSPDNPVITVWSRNDLNAIQLMIKDNGKGIPANDLKNVFEKFYRVPTGDVHDVKGFGLGLFYVRSILKAHTGTITVESKPMEGSTFTITLPLIQNS